MPHLALARKLQTGVQYGQTLGLTLRLEEKGIMVEIVLRKRHMPLALLARALNQHIQ